MFWTGTVLATMLIVPEAPAHRPEPPPTAAVAAGTSRATAAPNPLLPEPGSAAVTVPRNPVAKPPAASPPAYLPDSQPADGPVIASGYSVPGVTVDGVFSSGAPCEFPSRWSVRHDVGDGVGFENGFTYVEGFIPLWQPPGCELFFGDARVVNFDDADRWEFNLGAGYRLHAASKDAVLGVNGFYDGRHTDTNFFHQLGLGVEALFARWEVRANGYLIVGPHRRLAGDTGEFPVSIGGQPFIGQLLTHDVAMSGFDVEAGVLLPALECVAPRVFVGAYHYESDHLPSANGVRARLEAWLGRNITLHCAVQHDDVFDTTITGGLAIHLGGADIRRDACCDPPRSIDERLGQRVVRDVNIVVAQSRTLLTRAVPPPPEDPPVVVQEPPPLPDNPLPPPPDDNGDESPGCKDKPPKCVKPREEWDCLPFPGRPGDPSTFPGHKFPPGFHHPCFPGKGRYKKLDEQS